MQEKINSALIKKKRKEKRKEQEDRLRKQKERLKYAKEHPEEVQIGKIYYHKSKAGYTIKNTITGQLQGLPLIKWECSDPEYIELDKNQAPYEISVLFTDAIFDMETATRRMKSLYKKFSEQILSAYRFNWTDGRRYLYPELERAWTKLKKIMTKIEKLANIKDNAR